MIMRSAYILYKRAAGGKKGRVYYAAFWNEERYDYVRRSTGQTSRAAADAQARKWLAEGVPLRSSQTFLGYLSSFWVPGSDYLQRREARGHKLSRSYIRTSHSAVEKYLKPYLIRHKKQKLALAKVTAGLLESFLMDLRSRGLSASRINGIRKAIAVPLSEAFRLGYINTNPAARVEKLPEKAPKREILSLEEVRSFFLLDWNDLRHYVANLVAATTGMRLGEIRGLQADDVGDGFISVRHNWQDREGLKEPKWGSRRNVPLPQLTEEALRELIELNPWDDGFVVYGYRRGIPLSTTAIEHAYYQGLKQIGIDEEERKRRKLTFHTWRHWYNSMLRGHIPDHSLRALTGHRTEVMQDRYSTITDEQRQAIRKLSNSVFKN